MVFSKEYLIRTENLKVMLRCAYSGSSKIPGPSEGHLGKFKTTNIKFANARVLIDNEYLLYPRHCDECYREFNMHNCPCPKQSIN